MLEKIIDKTKNEDLLFLTAIIINIMNDKRGSHSEVLPELMSTVGLDTTITLIKYFGGSTIHIPTHEDMHMSILLVVAYYLRKFENKDWDEIKDELNIDSISPHTLGRLVGSIDKRLNLEMEDIKRYGVDEYFEFLKSKVKGK